ncbi:glycosyltransferase family 2 protein [Magnetospirillum sp. 15-1]|uniref:glycosyltransferase family 2 protein n=1 Tax=Magnetospirillum sp. 15-1 TaxID=1979370 RepID=UPI0014835F63|nr:glycosyltransferase family 2 protein [Magnetospirillum sp. 15-1]
MRKFRWDGCSDAKNGMGAQMQKIAAAEYEKELVSIISPFYNEEDCIDLFFERLHAVVKHLSDRYRFELIFTNNCSTDGSLEKVLAICNVHSYVQVVTLSRNFGYQASMLSGLRNASGDITIFIDTDGEDPPEMIEQFLNEWKNGYDVVYGERVDRPEPPIIQAARKAFYRITKFIADYDFIVDMAEFSCFSRSVRQNILQSRSTHPFIRAEIAYSGYRRIGIPYRRHPRIAGTSKFSLVRMTKFAIAGILSSSTFPLRLSVYLAGPIGLFDFFAALYCLFGGAISLPALIAANMSAILIALSSIAMYVARIYKDGLQRNVFVIDQAKSRLNHE